jgi:hypothetical protein
MITGPMAEETAERLVTGVARQLAEAAGIHDLPNPPATWIGVTPSQTDLIHVSPSEVWASPHSVETSP